MLVCDLPKLDPWYRLRSLCVETCEIWKRGQWNSAARAEHAGGRTIRSNVSWVSHWFNTPLSTLLCLRLHPWASPVSRRCGGRCRGWKRYHGLSAPSGWSDWLGRLRRGGGGAAAPSGGKTLRSTAFRITGHNGIAIVLFLLCLLLSRPCLVGAASRCTCLSGRCASTSTSCLP